MQKSVSISFYSGLSGLQLPIPKLLYPSPFENAARLTYYASLFNSIEFNSTFYNIPKPSTVSKWTNLVPKKFKFTFKLWKGITHNKNLEFKKEDVNTFLTTISAVKNKRGCLLIQLPPSLGISNIGQLNKLLGGIKDIDATQNWNLAVEFRNKSWYHEDIYDLLKFYKSAIVIHDIPKSATPILNHKSDFIYIRFHGPTGNYRDSYSIEFLSDYAAYINEWVAEGKQVYVYFNNTMGDAFDNLKTLNELVAARKCCSII